MRSRIGPGKWLVTLAACWLVTIIGLQAAPRTWNGAGADALGSNPANWVGGIAPVAGDDIVLDATTNKNMTWDAAAPSNVASWFQVGYVGTVTVSTVYGSTGFTNLTIVGNCTISNGVWTHVANTLSETYLLRATVGGDFTLGTGGAINVDGKGYSSERGPGAATGVNLIYSGASYGGEGCIDGSSTLGPAYGSATSPTNLGSGGGSAVGNSAGGGAVQFVVAGGTTHSGLISAGGLGGGAGGSIYLTTATLTGSGTNSVNGGNSAQRGGGSGRLAVILTGSDSFGSISNLAYGGTSVAGGEKASCGTIHLKRQSDAFGAVIVDNNNVTTLRVSPINNVVHQLDSIIVTNRGAFLIGANAGVTLPGDGLRGDTNSRLIVAEGFFTPTSNLSIAGTTLSRKGTNWLVVNTAVTVGANGAITHEGNATGVSNSLCLRINGFLDVTANGAVHADGKGYQSQAGVGKSYGSYVTYDGGSHGGQGYNDTRDTRGLTYGSLTNPVTLGSGGGFGAGGGLVCLVVNGVITNEGRISAKGADSGSGGSVNITAADLAGSGVIQANGGDSASGRGGGGGRLLLSLTNATTFGTASLQAFGGYASADGGRYGGAGTVYRRKADDVYGELIVDNSNHGASAETVISSNTTDTVVGKAMFLPQARLTLATNQSLTVCGDWSNAATFVAQSGSALILAGTNPAAIFGTNSFDTLTCTEPGKTLRFAAGSSNAVQALGQLILTGSASSNVVLQSTVDGTPWKLNLSASANQSIMYVDVKDSDASSGSPAIAVNSTNSGGNSNWIFATAGQTNTWTGSSNTVWGTTANWNLGRAPIAQDNVVIPSSLARYPVLDVAKTISGLQVQSGASLGLAGFNLTVSSNAVMAGALNAAGTEVITFGSDVNFTGGSVVPARSTVVIGGSTAQSVTLGGLTFDNVRVNNNVGTVTFPTGFTANELRCEATSGLPSMVFQQAATYTIRDLVLLGSTTATNVTLRSSSAGQAWNLNVGAYSLVKGVDVRDSDAGAGKTINPIASKDSGNNPNWTFGQDWSQWLGTNGTSFHVANNWSPATVPGATARVLIESTNTATITNPVSIRQLIVGGGSQPAQMTINTNLTVAEDMLVLNNGTIAMNQPTVVSNDVVVLAGGTITHAANGSIAAYTINLNVLGALVVDLGGQINADGKGYPSLTGVGKPPGPSYATFDGGSHGGQGHVDWRDVRGLTYGSLVNPMALGSGGGKGPGGGLVYLVVSGAITNDGSISAKGGDSGSGGSVNLTAASLTGTGVINANGGDSATARGGGGGRLRISLTSATTFGAVNLQAFGGYASADGGRYGGAGTVYLKTPVQPTGEGRVIIDNNNQTATAFTQIPPATNAIPDELERVVIVVTNRAVMASTTNTTIGELLIYTNCSWTLTNWTVSVFSREHSLEDLTKRGPGATNRVDHYDQILWIGSAPGTVFLVR